MTLYSVYMETAFGLAIEADDPTTAAQIARQTILDLFGTLPPEFTAVGFGPENEWTVSLAAAGRPGPIIVRGIDNDLERRSWEDDDEDDDNEYQPYDDPAEGWEPGSAGAR